MNWILDFLNITTSAIPQKQRVGQHYHEGQKQKILLYLPQVNGTCTGLS